jgi:tripartite-type tricarboxylate transporter receptor subunit TctC
MMKKDIVVPVFVLAFIFLTLFPGFAAPDDYPTKPVQIIVPFTAGGSLDLSTRLLAEKLREYLGQPVLVMNKPGAGTALGASFAATSKPDGYTIYASSGATYGFLHLLNPGFTFGLKDFIPIAAIGAFPSVFAVYKDVPVKTLPELVTYVETHPGALTYCSTGFGGLNHLEFEMLKLSVKKKLDIQHVPYQGVNPALTALLGNQVQVCTLPYSSLVKKNDGKLIRILAVMRPKRLSFIPEVPTTGEAGYPELDSNNYYLNYNAPARTPPAVIAKLEAAFEKAMQDKDLRKRLEQLDIQPEYLNSRDLQKWLEGQVRKFEPVIRKANIQTK